MSRNIWRILKGFYFILLVHLFIYIGIYRLPNNCAVRTVSVLVNVYITYVYIYVFRELK